MTLTPTSAPLRMGVFGGAFDPPHLAHVAIAHAAVAQLQLDVLKIFPTGQAWHKKRSLTTAEHRLAMAHLAFDGLPCVEIDDRELLRAGPTYTIDTLTQLQDENPRCQLFLILGADQAKALKTWHRWQDILQITIISVAGRADGMGAEVEDSAAMRTNFTPQHLQSQPAAGTFIPNFEPLILPPMTVSATEIRQRVAAGLGTFGLVSEPIARYIAQHHLYLSP